MWSLYINCKIQSSFGQNPPKLTMSDKMTNRMEAKMTKSSRLIFVSVSLPTKNRRVQQRRRKLHSDIQMVSRLD
ncbi:unnamed protein product [Larinioides sclopetarius]|uniref:Uncharacterized protein n=1 Tax=Larinioides sclopetarius TaxID=280406 RepID=A0AAV2BB46_9ARAC